VTFQTFYNSLASEGTWIQTAQFGDVWQPNVSDPQWAPYTDGHWVYSDAGWTWASNEPWGWATYHYGRWVNLDGTGWCWVPGYTWAPAWVSWRYGDGYVGWAPLPPDSLIGVDYDAGDDGGFHIGGDCDSYYGIGAGWYSFLPIVYLGDDDYRNYYVRRNRNYGIINRTTNVTNLNVTRAGGRAGNVFAGASLGGPSIRLVDAQSQVPVARVNLAFTDRVGGGEVGGGNFSIYAPRVEAGAGPLRPAAETHAVGRVAINRGTDAAHPLTVTSRLSSPAATTDEVRQARTAQTAAPFDAHVAPGAAVPADSERPFTSLRPSAGTAAEPGRSYPGGASTANGGGAYRPTSSYATPAASGARTSSSGGGAATGSRGESGGSRGGSGGGSTQGH
jgi:hypothetical protein